MVRRRRGRWRTTPASLGALALLGAIVVLGGCTQGGLAPSGPGADRLADTFWSLLAAAGGVFVVVATVFVLAVRRRGEARNERTEAPGDDRHLERRWLVGGGVVLPVVVLSAVLVFDLDLIAAEPPASELTIEVVGHRYWWEVGYEDFATANEIVVPVDTPVEVELTSDDVIHSFWVPELAGKVDLVPGRTNRLVFEASEPGRYVGRCAEFCGLQHARMAFAVEAVTAEEFATWRQTAAAPAAEPTTTLERRGREVFLESSCVGCHSIRGVSEVGDLGPDLTHLELREELAAGAIDNTAELLGAWIVNPQAIKPGAQMPPQPLSEAEVDALVAYLGGER